MIFFTHKFIENVFEIITIFVLHCCWDNLFLTSKFVPHLNLLGAKGSSIFGISRLGWKRTHNEYSFSVAMCLLKKTQSVKLFFITSMDVLHTDSLPLHSTTPLREKRAQSIFPFRGEQLTTRNLKITSNFK